MPHVVLLILDGQFENLTSRKELTGMDVGVKAQKTGSRAPNS